MTFITENDVITLDARRKKLITLFIAATAAFLVISVGVLLLSYKKEWLWYFVADVILTVAYGWFAVWFFTNPFFETDKLLDLYKKTERSNTFVETGVFGRVIPAYKDGLYIFRAEFKEGDLTRDLDLTTDVGFFEEGVTYTLTVRANVIISAEKTL